MTLLVAALPWQQLEQGSPSSPATRGVAQRSGWPDFPFAFHSGEEIGLKMLARIGKKTGLRPEDV